MTLGQPLLGTHIRIQAIHEALSYADLDGNNVYSVFFTVLLLTN